ncbi:MAG: DSD1 family PLP-dependent enzyme [Fuerstiella sp.]|nr:DSD1 family PLP-dependent enzyme [Fuerstiella sp.]
MNDHLPPLGCSKTEISTPYLCLDLDHFEANVQSMVAVCRESGIQWRPHAKCHKSPVIAEWLLNAGAGGITCATVREAEVMADAGVSDILIANMIAGSAKVQRLVQVAQQADILICLDNIDQATAISQAMSEAGASVRVLIELEIGLNRVGIAAGPSAIKLGSQVNELPGLQLTGLMAYEGHLLTIEDPAEKESAIRSALGSVVELKKQFEQSGLPCPIVSCGGTGSYPFTVKQPGITEIQAGGAIFMDAFYRHACRITELQYALSVQTTVVSLPTPERAIIDAGHKTMNLSVHRPFAPDHPDLTVDWLSAEHGAIARTPDGPDLEIGQQLELIPGYGDLTNIFHTHFHAFRNGQLEQLIPIVR